MGIATLIDSKPLILWDLNGVLVDDEPLHEQCFRELLANYFGIELCHEDYNNFFLGKTDKLGFIDFFSQVEKSIPNLMLDTMCSNKHRLYESLSAKGLNLNLDAVTLLDDLSSNGYRQALVTCDKESDVAKLLQKNLPNAFEVIITNDDVKYSKPSSEPYLQAITKLCGSSNCLVIEDSLAGALSGQAAGAQVAVINEQNDTEFLRELYSHSLENIFVSFDEIRSTYNL